MPAVIALNLVETTPLTLNLVEGDVTALNLVAGTEITWEIAGLGGPPGPQGDPATITVGTTTTGLPGTNADVTNSGTATDAVLDFVIPQGAKGDKGDPGDSGGFWRHTQASAATSWIVVHSLGYRPSVSVEDTAGEVWIPSGIQHLDANSLRIDFDIPFSGYANCS